MGLHEVYLVYSESSSADRRKRVVYSDRNNCPSALPKSTIGDVWRILDMRSRPNTCNLAFEWVR